MRIIFHPFDFQYKIRNNQALVYLYGKLPDGKTICVIVPHEPFFYAKIKDIAAMREKLLVLSVSLGNEQGKITRWQEVEKELLGKKEQFYQIFTTVPKAVPPLSRELEQMGIPCYEKDILFVHRFLRDTGILPFGEVEAEGEFRTDMELRVPAFFASSVIPQSHAVLKKLKVLALDIETYAKTRIIDMVKNPILMVAFSGIDEQGKIFKKLLTWKHFQHSLEYVEIVSDEAALLKRVHDILLEYQPDALATYNGDGFDLPYLKIRADKWKVPLTVGLDFSAVVAGEDSKIAGMLHLDLHQFVRRIFGRNMKTDSYSLDNVAGELLGHGKHKVDLDILHRVWDNEPEKLEEFCRYNMHDADLTLQLCQKLLPDMIEFSQITGLPTFDGIRQSFSRLVEAYILKRAGEFNVLAPNKPVAQQIDQRMDQQYEGGFVYQPTPGVYQNIVVFDFRSLYPTVISAHQIGPETLQCDCCKENTVPGFPEYWFCRKKKGFLPLILEELIARRADVKRLVKQAEGREKNMLEARSYALKLLANAFYGYLGFYGARWYSFASARATTAYARNYIQSTIEKAQQAGFQVIYADTDSCFLLLGSQELGKASAFMESINRHLPGQMELELEGHYRRGLFVALKGGDKGGSDKGAKKKYALLRDNGSLKITGFETVRRNWSALAKDVQKDVLLLVLEEKTQEALQYVRQVVEELKQGRITTERLVIKTKLTRGLGDYSSIGPHVMVARRMQEKGYPVGAGTMVLYVIQQGVGIIRDRAALPEDVPAGKYDGDYYLKHQIIPAVESIFAVFGISEDELFSESKQTGLGKYF